MHIIHKEIGPTIFKDLWMFAFGTNKPRTKFLTLSKRIEKIDDRNIIKKDKVIKYTKCGIY